MVAVRGSKSRMVVLLWFSESLTVSEIRYDTSVEMPEVGTLNEPPLIPLVGDRIGLACPFRYTSTFQVSALTGKLPSSGSVPVPAKLMVSPALKRVPAVGVVIVATGG